jgi:signal transduction histidine kinase
MRHAQATRVHVVLTRSNGLVSVVIEDNGRGFDLTDAPKDRLGLVGMRERAELIGGNVEIESFVGHGTCVSMNIPL